MVNYNLNLVFQALADPTRRAILTQVHLKEKRISALHPPTKMSLAAISKHVKVLEKSGLIIRKKIGREIFVRLNHEAMMSADEWISTYTLHWNQQLDSLDSYLNNLEPPHD